MASVTFDHVTKRFDNVVAVDDLVLEIPDQEFIVLVGPSGCGKSTTLRLLAGLDEITQGEIRIGDRLVNNVPARDRDIAMVFQSYALYPHMSVYENMAFGLSLRKIPKQEIRSHVNEAASILGIEELLKRKPRALSGGQRQRVALGRAIVRDPAVFLFDEPLSNLDAKLRVQTRAEIRKLHERLGTTFIYVTHDQIEAMTMATKIAVMKDGLLQQVGTPQELYDRPQNMFVAGFIGSPSINLFEGTVKGSRDDMYLDSSGFRVPVPAANADQLMPYLGKKVVFGIRPENIHDQEFQPFHIEAAPVKALVDTMELMGNEVLLYLLVDKTPFLARVDPRTKARAGQEIQVVFDTARTLHFDPQTEAAVGAPATSPGPKSSETVGRVPPGSPPEHQ